MLNTFFRNLRELRVLRGLNQFHSSYQSILRRFYKCNARSRRKQRFTRDWGVSARFLKSDVQRFR